MERLTRVIGVVRGTDLSWGIGPNPRAHLHDIVFPILVVIQQICGALTDAELHLSLCRQTHVWAPEFALPFEELLRVNTIARRESTAVLDGDRRALGK